MGECVHVVDRLYDRIDAVNSYLVVGLDPRIGQVPEEIKARCIEEYGNTKKAVAEAFIEFNKTIIDAVHDLIPAVKPQMAFYEKYGPEGVRAFEETVAYAKSKGLIVIEDAKRNDIGSTAQAYSQGHLGLVDLIDGSKVPGIDADLLTVNAYLGIDGVKPFIEDCEAYGKGIFILDKTSNNSSGDLQDLILKESGIKVFELMAELINEWGKEVIGERGYSAIGAVVGATYPEQAENIRKLIPRAVLLVPGYGAQGGGGDDVVPCFNEDGYGAIVNSSRGIIFAYLKDEYKGLGFAEAARQAVKDATLDINGALARAGKKAAWNK